MEEFDDILTAFSSNEKPAEEKVEEPKKTYNQNGYNQGGYNNNNNGGYKKPYNNNYNGPKKEKEPSVWDMTVFKPEKVNVENAKQVKAFTVFIHGKEEISLSTIESVIKIAKVLHKKGFVFRCIGDTKDVVTTEIAKIEGMKVEFYLPFKKFNEDVTEPVTKLPSLKACCTAANYHGLYNMNTKVNIQLSPLERMKLGSKIHVMLGKECNEHLSLMLVINGNGDTAVVKRDNKIDYKNYGNILFPLDVVKDTNIKVMNPNQTGFNDKIVAYLKDLSDVNTNNQEI